MTLNSDCALSVFTEGVVRWASPAELAKLYAPDLSAEIVERLTASPRLSHRHAAFVAEMLGTADLSSLDLAERTLVTASPATLDKAAIMAGAAWHGRRVRSLILAADVNAFLAEFGGDARQAALQYPQLTTSVDDPDTPLSVALRRDGFACRAAWLEQLPSPIRRRLALRLAGSPSSFEDSHRVMGPQIIRQVATNLITS